MKERPIIMSAAMVRAILDGSKTQTRRVCNAARVDGDEIDYRDEDGWPLRYIEGAGDLRAACPYGVAGDHLWVRENGWQRPDRTARMMREGADTWQAYYFDADGCTSASDIADFKEWGFKRRPSIHMPRWASRITLEVTHVGVERLGDISEQDAIAEGMPSIVRNNRVRYGLAHWPQHRWHCTSARGAFQALWQSIHGEDSWKPDTWVWAVAFKRVGNS